ncbi:hypothetical protein BDP27DRAFT_1401729 [Rhodocollybia butyracea]|uniref:Mid2 domain-containing protein n=1 Tax=Rhodocollybia butyracea TaxID=206335 RepID=A0A9P5PRM1_9AGAR|nr:hypothetical protein BDP27DRAFT_1401729 [Rhodocollybia butyracea]
MLLFIVLCSLVLVVLSQTTHIVTVGDDGSFYDPPTTSAGMNDIVNFVFTGLRQHSVTQSSLATPCLPLEGGFNSGLTSLSNSTDPNEAPVWQLQITNASTPIYFFCMQSIPLSHCSVGMVGAINPPSQDVYNSLLSLAKNTTSTATSLIPYAATGIGAVAQQTLALSSVGIGFLTAESSSQTSTSSMTSTATVTPTPTGESSESNNIKKSNTGAIVGGVVGGVLGAGLIVTGIVLLLLRRHRRTSRNPPSQMYQQYFTPPPTAGLTDRGMSEHVATPISGTIPMPISPPPHQQITPSAWRTGNEESRMYIQPPLTPNRSIGNSVSVPATSTRHDDHQSLGGSDLSDMSQNYGGTNIKTLAKEVAAVMLQNNASGVSREGTTSSGRQVDTIAENKLHGSPPQYRANE